MPYHFAAGLTEQEDADLPLAVEKMVAALERDKHVTAGDDYKKDDIHGLNLTQQWQSVYRKD